MTSGSSEIEAHTGPGAMLVHALQAGHVEHALHTVNNPLSIAAAATGATMPLLVVPTVAYLGTRLLLKDHPRGDGVATNFGLAVGSMVDGLFGEGGLLHPRVARIAPAAVTTASEGSRLLTGVGKFAGLLGKAIPAAIAVGGGVSVVGAVRDADGDLGAIVHTHEGREGALRALGGVLSLAPLPWVRIAGAGAFLLAAANDNDMLSAFDLPGAAVKR
jgi:hypothetical protein